MKLYYNGVDITRRVYINRCEHETFAEKRADRLMVRFADSGNRWDGWQPKSGDTIRYRNKAADTGVMYISRIAPANGLITFWATSMPPTGETRKSRTWENIRLLKIGEDIAAEHGLKFQAYGITDRVYSYIRQDNQTDFDFLQTRCLLEGCAMLVYDGRLVVYDERTRENARMCTRIKIGTDGVFEFSDRSGEAYSSAEVTSGEFFGTFYANDVQTGRVLRPRQVIECASNEEALRFARGILRDANKNVCTGCFRRKLTCDYAAGSVIEIDNAKASGWNGKVFVTRTRMDYVKGEIKIFFRKIGRAHV